MVEGSDSQHSMNQALFRNLDHTAYTSRPSGSFRITFVRRCGGSCWLLIRLFTTAGPSMKRPDWHYSQPIVSRSSSNSW